jgi:hypothetical protein
MELNNSQTSYDYISIEYPLLIKPAQVAGGAFGYSQVAQTTIDVQRV